MSGYHYRGGDGRRTASVVPLGLIHVHPSNIRKDLGDLTELTGSIRRRGVMVPVILEPFPGGGWRIRDGHRRFAAAQLAGLDKIPAIIHDRALTDPDWALQAVEVNEHRQGLSPEERRDNVLRLRDMGWSFGEIGEAYGVCASTASAWAKWTEEKKRESGHKGSPGHPHTVGKKKLRGLLDDWAGQLPDEFVTALTELIDPPAAEETAA